MKKDTNRTLTDHEACLEKKSSKTQSRSSLNSPKLTYATILKQPFRTVRLTNAPAFVPSQVCSSLNLRDSLHDFTQGDDSLLEIL